MSLWTDTTLASRYLLEPPGKFQKLLGRAAGSWQEETMAMGQPLYRGHLMCQAVGVPLLSPRTPWRQVQLLSLVRTQEGRQKSKVSARLEVVCSKSAPSICDCGMHTHARTHTTPTLQTPFYPSLPTWLLLTRDSVWHSGDLMQRELPFPIKIQPASLPFFPPESLPWQAPRLVRPGLTEGPQRAGVMAIELTPLAVSIPAWEEELAEG